MREGAPDVVQSHFYHSTLNYLDVAPPDSDPTDSLFSGARITGSDSHGPIHQITISGLDGNTVLSLSGQPNFTLQHVGNNWVLVFTGSTGNSDAAWANALNAIKFTTTTDGTTTSPVNEHMTLTAMNGALTPVTLFTNTVTSVHITCFYPGTMIRTPAGEAPVESLTPGDFVLTADGVARKVNWLGRQTVSTVFADPMRVLPIRIKAGAWPRTSRPATCWSRPITPCSWTAC